MSSVVVLDDWENGLRDGVDWQALRQSAEGGAHSFTVHNVALRGAALEAALAGADCVVLLRDRTPVDAALIARLPRLRHIVFTGTRNKTLDVAAAQRAGIQVSHTEWGPSKASTCEMTWSLILAATRRLPQLMLTPERNVWRDPAVTAFLPDVLQGQKLGLIGLGQIGQRVATVGRALGMEVLTWSPHMTPERAREHDARAVDLDELLASSQVVSLHLVPAAGTRRLLNRERLALMQPDSLLVNTSRAELVDTDAVVDALRAGRPGFGAFDVFDDEPLPDGHPLLGLPNVLLTPHYGFLSKQVYAEFARGVQRNIGAWLSGGEVPNTVPLAA